MHLASIERNITMYPHSLESLTRWCEIDLDLLAHNIAETKKTYFTPQ